MAAPLIWLAIYLSAGSLVLWACYRTSVCRLGFRAERNARIAGFFSGSGGPKGPLSVTTERAPASR
ncbi:MAG TPA: hypothetical protein VFV09_10155 [Actinomycetota bacterium]|jgi:hypothetical protein|nr:hypothetical protein [Actinomycetota bacterium]